MPKCSGCDIDKPDEAFVAEGDETCGACLFEQGDLDEAAFRALEAKSDDLPVVDLTGVEILAAGGPYFGQGSPPEGDFFNDADLSEYATNMNALIAANELTSPNKIGHDSKQTLLKLSGLTKGEEPAAGWLENFRVDDGKLLADVKDVPRKLAKLIKAKAFRKRSVELSTVTPQTKAGKKLGKRVKVIKALSWLGAQAPAVRTLDDIIALYHDDVSAATLMSNDELDADVRTVDFAEGDVVWSTKDGYQARRDAVQRALNPVDGSPRYWVSDVADSKALVCGNGTAETWVVPYAMDNTGDVTISPSSDWVVAQQEWVQAPSEYLDAAEAHAQLFGGVDDTTPRMPKKTPKANGKPELTPEQITALAEAFGIDEADDTKRAELVVAKMGEYQETPDPDPATPPDPDPDPPDPDPAANIEPETQLSEADIELLRAQAKKGETAFEERRKERITAQLDKATAEGRLDPAKREVWEQAFDDNEDRAAVLLSDMPVDNDLLKVYGVDDDGTDSESREKSEDAMYRGYAGFLGIGDTAVTLRSDS